MRSFMLDKGFKTLRFIDAFRFGGKENGVAVESNTDLIDLFIGWTGAGDDTACSDIVVDGLLYIGCMRRKEQIRLECLEIGRHFCAADERGTCDIEIVILNGFENAQAGIRAVSGHDDHLDHLFFAGLIQTKKCLDQLKCGAFGQRVVFMLFLIGGICLKALFFKDPVFCFQVKQRTGGDADYQRFGQVVGHKDTFFRICDEHHYTMNDGERQGEEGKTLISHRRRTENRESKALVPVGHIGYNAGKRGERYMRVLDLDMDFFLSAPCPLAAYGERPDESCAQAYSDEEVRRFLEEQCGLNKAHPVPGAIFETHDQAMDFWQARLQDGSLKMPFEVVHVDTHSDLAFGPPGTGYVMNVVLSRREAQRAAVDAYREIKELDEANYLLFALAFRWISRLTYVRNPKSHQDIPKQLLDSDGNIFLRSYVSALMEGMNGKEPVIPFEVYDDYRTFHQEGYDFVTMAQSPRYAPASSDRIMNILREYISEIPIKNK